MGAQSGVEGDIARLLESADEVACFENRPQHRGGIAGIGAQITVTQIGRQEKRWAAGQIKNDIAIRLGIVARRPEHQRAARGRRGLREIVDHKLERAEMTSDISDLAFRHRKIVNARRQDARGRFDQHGDVKTVFEQVTGFDGSFVTAADQDDAGAFEFDEGHRRRGLGRRRKQRRHFRTGIGSFAGPSRRLPKIGKLDRTCASTFYSRFGKTSCFLRTSNRQRRVLCRDRQEPIEFGAAKLGRGGRFAVATAADRAAVKRHRVVAGADQEMPGGVSHRAPNFL
jgi:hypothetical protein